MRELDGRVALVTGAGRGIGRAVALKLAGNGARIVLGDLDEEVAAAAAREIRIAGGEAIVVAGDVSMPEYGNTIVNRALDAFGDLHIIVNNAGYTWDNVIQKTSDDQFQSMLDVHVAAPFRILRAAAEPIRAASKREAAEGRRIVRKVVNISSVAGVYGNSGQAGYASGKAAVIGLTKTLAKEWGRFAVTVNCVAFGLVNTRLTQPITADPATIDVAGREIRVGIQPALIDMFEKMIPLGRAGTPEEAAGAVYLFCSPDSDYVSGQLLVCSGGLTI